MCVCVCVTACQKTENAKFNLDHVSTSNSELKSIPEFVLQAREHLEQGPVTMRSSTQYTPAQSLNYLNHGLNYDYCRPDENFATYKMVVDSFYLPVDSLNMVDEQDVLDLYADIALMAGNFYHSETNNTKQPFNFELRFYDNIQVQGAPVEAIFIMGVGSCSSLNSYPYTSTDIWYAQPEGGNCYYNAQVNDAMDHFRCDLNATLNYRNKFIPYYFSDRYSVCFDVFDQHECFGNEIDYLTPDLVIEGDDLLNPNDVTPNDNWKDKLLFFKTTTQNNALCLTVAEMDFYNEEMSSLSTSYEPTTKVIGKHEVGHDLLLGSGYNGHVMRVDYYTRNVIEVEEDAEPTELPCTGC